MTPTTERRALRKHGLAPCVQRTVALPRDGRQAPCPTPREDGSYFCAKHAGAARLRGEASIRPERGVLVDATEGPQQSGDGVLATVIVVIIVVVAAVNASSGDKPGSHNGIHIVRSTTKPFEGCARPNWYAWVTSAGRQLAAD